MSRKTLVIAAACAAGLGLSCPVRGEEPASVAPALEEAVKVRKEAGKEAAQSQKRVDVIADQTDQMVAEYRATLKQVDSLKKYNAHVEQLLASQEKELGSLRSQIEEAAEVTREVTPLLRRMVDTLDTFVSLDVPFLASERRDRVTLLRELLGRADVTDAEKYRRVMEAYQIESDYGRTIEAYQGTLTADDKERTVDFLRVGRVSLLYQTLDGEDVGVWNQDTKRWEKLDAEFRTPVRQGLRIARKQAAPDLVTLPVPAPREAK